LRYPAYGSSAARTKDETAQGNPRAGEHASDLPFRIRTIGSETEADVRSIKSALNPSGARRSSPPRWDFRCTGSVWMLRPVASLLDGQPLETNS
jgi:hypothetical protein